MKVIKENIGGVSVLIETIDEELLVVGEKQGVRATQQTGLSDDVKAAYTKAKSIIKNIAEDIGKELESIQEMARPKQVEMEFNIGISAQAGPVWILTSKGDYGLKVKMTWDLSVDAKNK